MAAETGTRLVWRSGWCRLRDVFATKKFGEARSGPPEVLAVASAGGGWGELARTRAPEFLFFTARLLATFAHLAVQYNFSFTIGASFLRRGLRRGYPAISRVNSRPTIPPPPPSHEPLSGSHCRVIHLTLAARKKVAPQPATATTFLSSKFPHHSHSLQLSSLHHQSFVALPPQTPRRPPQ